MSFNLAKIPEQPQRVAIVTGANNGLGFQTTKAFARKKITVIMACRDLDKAKVAKENILKILPQAKLDLIHLDLASFESVRSFAREFLEKYDRLDLLINNAGVMVPPFQKTEDYNELQWQVNYLSHFMLTGLLIKMLQKTAGSRIITLSSKAHEKASIHFEDINSEHKYSKWKAYGQSKLACLIFAKELDRRLKSVPGCTTLAACAHPGISNTGLFRYFPAWFNKTLGKLLAPVMSHSPEKAVQSSLNVALGSNIKGGEYYGPSGYMGFKGAPGPAEYSGAADNIQVAQRLWKVSEKMTGLEYL